MTVSIHFSLDKYLGSRIADCILRVCFSILTPHWNIEAQTNFMKYYQIVFQSGCTILDS